jgi:protein PhnA
MNGRLTLHLQLTGSPHVVRQGARARGIRLVDKGDDSDCRSDGLGAMMLKSEFVKKQR